MATAGRSTLSQEEMEGAKQLILPIPWTSVHLNHPLEAAATQATHPL